MVLFITIWTTVVLLVVKGRMRLRIEEREWRRMHESSRVE